MSIEQELAEARDDLHIVAACPNLALRAKLAQFAVQNGLRREADALLVVAARYFRMVESERWAGWFEESRS